MSFFHTTPMGRIINRLTKDTSDVDKNLADFASFFLRSSLQLVTTVVLIGFYVPFALAALIPILLCFYLLYAYFQVSLCWLTVEYGRTSWLNHIHRCPQAAHCFCRSLTKLVFIWSKPPQCLLEAACSSPEQERIVSIKKASVHPLNLPLYHVWTVISRRRRRAVTSKSCNSFADQCEGGEEARLHLAITRVQLHWGRARRTSQHQGLSRRE